MLGRISVFLAEDLISFNTVSKVTFICAFLLYFVDFDSHSGGYDVYCHYMIKGLGVQCKNH